MTNKYYLAIEFVLLCIALPTVIIVFRLAPYMFFFLWSACAFCWSVYRHYYSPHLPRLWRFETVTWENMKPILIRWVICCCGILVFTYFYDPDKLFYMVKERPQLIAFLLVFYTLFSALPQEFIFCTFFFERYAPFFKTDKVRIVASAIVFAYAHVLFINPVAPIGSFIGGLIFAQTFAKHRSLALVTIEHGLYGNFLFISGLGWYFWAGGVV